MENSCGRATHLTTSLPPPLLPQAACFGRLAVAHVTPPWASSTLTNDDNILNWSGSSISGTQTQISGSSPVKRAPWHFAPASKSKPAAFSWEWHCLDLCRVHPCAATSARPPHILFCISFALRKSAFSVAYKKKCPEIYCWKMEYWIWFIATGVWNIPKNTQLLFWLTGGTCFVTRICATVYPSLPTTSCLSHYLSWHREEEQQPLHLCFQV